MRFTIFFTILSSPVILAQYFSKQTGREYGVGFFAKFFLALKIIWNSRAIITASSYIEHMVMVSAILNIPKSVKGSLVECGTYKGGSTTNLSLVSAIVNRKLEVFDSFEGLPEPSELDKAHFIADRKEVATYSKGAWCGSLEEVKRNISKYGRINVCNFYPGYFDKTLPEFKKRVSFIFLDVDLRDSLEMCLKWLWPLLEDGCSLYTHEAQHMEIASLFFNEYWWRDNMNSDPPGLIGAGNGLGLHAQSGGFTSSLGYAIKNAKSLTLKEVPQIGL
jgi:O-methyltransferase